MISVAKLKRDHPEIYTLAERMREIRLNQPKVTWHEAKLQTETTLAYGALITDEEFNLMHRILRERWNFLWTFDQKHALVRSARDFIINNRTEEEKIAAESIASRS